MLIKYRKTLYSVFFFFLAGLCEIGGGYLVWLWLREIYSWIFGAIGGLVLFFTELYLFSEAYFHRTYVAYGSIFIIMAIGWGYFFEGIVPDTYDIMGIIIAT